MSQKIETKQGPKRRKMKGDKNQLKKREKAIKH
jgi:hypothetical protein